jgi:hypothetical protein
MGYTNCSAGPVRPFGPLSWNKGASPLFTGAWLAGRFRPTGGERPGKSCQGASPGGKDPNLGIGSGEAHRGGLATMMQVGGGEPARAGRRSGGEHRLGVHGAAVSSGRGRCGDGGARRWLEVALDGRVASATEGGGRLGASMVACGGRWLSGWLGVAQRHTRAVWGGRRFEQRSAATREQRSAVRAERSMYWTKCRCCFCLHDKTIQHLFYNCYYTRSLWGLTQIAFSITPPHSV